MATRPPYTVRAFSCGDEVSPEQTFDDLVHATTYAATTSLNDAALRSLIAKNGSFTMAIHDATGKLVCCIRCDEAGNAVAWNDEIDETMRADLEDEPAS